MAVRYRGIAPAITDWRSRQWLDASTPRGQRELTAAETERNHELSLTRRSVEKLFGTMKRSYRFGRMRAFGLIRATTDLILFCLAFNMRGLGRSQRG